MIVTCWTAFPRWSLAWTDEAARKALAIICSGKRGRRTEGRCLALAAMRRQKPSRREQRKLPRRRSFHTLKRASLRRSKRGLRVQKKLSRKNALPPKIRRSPPMRPVCSTRTKRWNRRRKLGMSYTVAGPNSKGSKAESVSSREQLGDVVGPDIVGLRPATHAGKR